MKKVLAIFLCVLMGTFGLAACGGGGGGGGGHKTTFNADYKGAMLNYDTGYYNSGFIGLNVPGTAVQNSTSGSISYKEYKDSNGFTNSGAANIDVDAYGLANITDPNGGDPMWGGATADGSVMFSVDSKSDTDNNINMLVGVNLSSGMSDSDLSGTYYCGMINNGPSGTAVIAFTFVPNGAGNFAVSGGVTGTGTYQVDANGSLSVTPVGESNSFSGAVRHDGEVFALSDTNGTDDLGLIVCVQDTGSHTLADAMGNYRLASFDVPIANSPSAGLHELYLDGQGGGSGADITNSAGFINSPILFPGIGYSVSGGLYQINIGGNNEPVFVTPNGDFMLIVGDNIGGGDGGLIVGAKFTPPGFPTEAFAGNVGGAADSYITSSFLSLNMGGAGIAPGASGTLSSHTLLSSDGYYESTSMPYSVNANGVITVNAMKTAWGFANAASGTYFLDITDQTLDDYVALIPGLMASTGLSNATANGLYNCVGMSGFSPSTYALNEYPIVFDGSGLIDPGVENIPYVIADNGLLTFPPGPGSYRGTVRADGNMLFFSGPATTSGDGQLTICMKDPYGHTMSDLNGSYIVGTFTIYNSATPSVESEIDQADLKGDGTGDLTALYNSTGMIPSPYSYTITNALSYGVDGSGVLVTDSGDPIYVTPSGDAFVTGSGDANKQQIIYGIRK